MNKRKMLYRVRPPTTPGSFWLDFWTYFDVLAASLALTSGMSEAAFIVTWLLASFAAFIFSFKISDGIEFDLCYSLYLNAGSTALWFKLTEG